MSVKYFYNGHTRLKKSTLQRWSDASHEHLKGAAERKARSKYRKPSKPNQRVRRRRRALLFAKGVQLQLEHPLRLTPVRGDGEILISDG